MQGRNIGVAGSGSSDTLNTIANAFLDERQAGLSKTAQLYNAISKMISVGRLQEDDKLPGERVLCAALGISLGTAQKSLNLLMRDGEVVREHGRGTFVRGHRRACNQLWHYCFRDGEKGELFPVYAKLISRQRVEGNPAVIEALGPDDAGFVRVERLMNIGDRFSCWSEMYLSMRRFKRLLELPKSTVESFNLKQVLNEQFDAPTLAVSQTAKVQSPPREVAKAMGIAARTSCLLLQITATSRQREPITFQRIFVPPVEYDLELGREPVDNARSFAA